MNSKRGKMTSPLFSHLRLDHMTLKGYAEQLQLGSISEAAHCVAEALSWSIPQNSHPDIALVLRTAPQPAIALLAITDEIGEAYLQAQGQAVLRGLRDLRVVGYSHAEEVCAQLAEGLLERFGREAVNRFNYTAIPRGGFIVLGMLSYVLDLSPKQIHPPYAEDIPLVIVDDCALSGLRFRDFLQGLEVQTVVFAPLYAHPEVLAAIEISEPRVLAAINGRDIRDFGPERLGETYAECQAEWHRRTASGHYWHGLLEHLCFPWNEPDRVVWNPTSKEAHLAWSIVPPRFCLKHRRPDTSSHPLPVQIQPPGKGPVRPSPTVLFGELKGEILVANETTGKTYGLKGVAADMWRAILKHGNEPGAGTDLAGQYDVEEGRLRRDLGEFIEDLLLQGLLERCEPGP